VVEYSTTVSVMTPAESSDAPAPVAAMSAARSIAVPWPALGVGLGLLLAGGAALLAWGLAELLAGTGPGAAPLAAALAVAVVVLQMAVLLLKMSRQIERSRLQIERLDTVDATTGVANRGHFLALAGREWSRARRYGSGAALLLVDVDRFQRLIETRGAAAGDAVLRALARHTEPTLRGGDALARFGGAQLAVWLAHADPIGALDVAERVRERIETLDIPFGEKTLRVTVSVGVAALRPAHLALAALIDDADAAVQAARQTGGNCVRAAPVDLGQLREIGPSVGDNQAAGPV
jgi:diguanylate cyclase (GGDEF)-like protein